MFNHLVESGSHAEDLSRKSSFFLVTLGAYALLLMLAGVGSIYAYDARLAQQSFAVEVLLPPTFLAETRESRPEPVRDERPRPAAGNGAPREVQQVTEALAPTTDPTRYNRQLSNSPVNIPPVGRDFIVTDRNVAPGTSSGGPASPFGEHGGNSSNSGGRLVETSDPPPALAPRPAPTPAPRPKAPISLGVIEGKVISKPAPAYPALARSARVAGNVTVQIIVDEQGKVISARAVNGHPLLLQAAVQAAYQARFTPTLLSQQPVKVSGIITYSFVLQ